MASFFSSKQMLGKHPSDKKLSKARAQTLLPLPGSTQGSKRVPVRRSLGLSPPGLHWEPRERLQGEFVFFCCIATCPQIGQRRRKSISAVTASPGQACRVQRRGCLQFKAAPGAAGSRQPGLSSQGPTGAGESASNLMHMAFVLAPCHLGLSTGLPHNRAARLPQQNGSPERGAWRGEGGAEL